MPQGPHCLRSDLTHLLLLTIFQYKFEVFMNGANVVSVENPEPVRYENVKVLADDSQFSYKPLDGKIRNLVIRSKDIPAA